MWRAPISDISPLSPTSRLPSLRPRWDSGTYPSCWHSIPTRNVVIRTFISLMGILKDQIDSLLWSAITSRFLGYEVCTWSTPPTLCRDCASRGSPGLYLPLTWRRRNRASKISSAHPPRPGYRSPTHMTWTRTKMPRHRNFLLGIVHIPES
ncbi:hypothetical protein BOTBODRAFT_562241 [Botryobasidium botryosum FD-172 SS1]|uniref:Uncharacterized protein n=1 Tax=Botryobasidium botryosum (strain FD-172 SS1) TaxID=930990 RepID=A0A067M9R4_BOTB1|nr:hypothetical protein BOTBODRAFT_562241 [Botryobasidium botryosum FD-172 SS1]